MKLESGKIEPGIGIGEFKINMSKEELLDNIGPCDFLSEHIIRAENAEFYLDHKDRVYQIVVRQGFKGKFLGHIVMESTIEEIRKYAGDVKEYDAEYWNMDVAYELKDYPGIRFELSKEDDYYRKKV